MKTNPILIAFFTPLIVSLCIIYLLATEFKKEKGLDQSTIDGLRKRVEDDKKRFEEIVRLKDDTIKIAKRTIIAQDVIIKNQELDKENYKRNTHDKIRFIPYTNDVQRDSILTSLYPSFRPIR